MKDGQKNIVKRPIIQKDLDGNIVAEYDSVEQARSRTGITSIHAVLHGRQKTSRGYTFEYKYPNDKIPKKRTLCLNCATSPYECSWKFELKPVDGWEAEKVPWKTAKGKDSYTYCVKLCPLYEELEKRKEN